MPAGEALETEGEVKGVEVDSLDLECSCILFIRVLPRLAGRTDSSAAALFRAALISAALSWKIYIGERRETSNRSRCLFVVGLSIERRASFFFLFLCFAACSTVKKCPKKKRTKSWRRLLARKPPVLARHPRRLRLVPSPPCEASGIGSWTSVE
jgi:hypothetical protein